jgi:predicted RecB family nuclease
MKLVKLENYQLTIEPELLLLKPFRRLYNNDKTKDKNKFIDFLTIVYFVYDTRSEYNYIVDETQRIEEVCKSNGFNVPKFSKEELECIEIYKNMTFTTSSLLLQDTKIAIDKVRQFLRDIDLSMTDDKGKPVYTINSVTTAIKQIPQLAKDVMEAEKMVAKEIMEQGRARGGNENKAIMEDGILL